jgi:hypothetical protein
MDVRTGIHVVRTVAEILRLDQTLRIVRTGC